MIDLHSHILPGIDDGPGALEGSLAFARAAVDAGITEIVATPHVSWRYANTAESIARRRRGAARGSSRRTRSRSCCTPAPRWR